MDPAFRDECGARWIEARDWSFRNRAVCSDFQRRKKCLSAEIVDWNSESGGNPGECYPSTGTWVDPAACELRHAWRTEPRQVVVPQNSGVKHTPRTLLDQNTRLRVLAQNQMAPWRSFFYFL